MIDAGAPATGAARSGRAGPSARGGRASARLVGIAAGVVIAVALPLVLIGANLDLLVNSGWIYSYNWWRNGIPEQTGLGTDELDQASRTIKTYFNSPLSQELLDVRVSFGGPDVSLYNDREVLHMRDVKTLVQGFWAAGGWSAAAIGVAFAAGLMAMRRRFWRVLAGAVRWSATGSVIAIVVIGAASLINFSAVFELFHVLSFANNLWQLSSQSDYLLIMFPEQFWLDATLLLGALIAAELAGVWLATRWLRTRAG